MGENRIWLTLTERELELLASVLAQAINMVRCLNSEVDESNGWSTTVDALARLFEKTQEKFPKLVVSE